MTRKEQHALLMSIGYTSEEALQLMAGKPEPTPQPGAPEPTQQPGPEPTQQPGPEPAPQAIDMAPLTKAIGEGFQMLKEQMIANNILNSRQKDQTETTDDIVANIIGPWQG